MAKIPKIGVRHTPVPRYHQVYVILREKIVTGEFDKGDLMPSEQELSHLFDVSRVTIRRALDLLAEEHLIRRSRGRGTFVSPKVLGRPVTASMEGQMENALSLGLRTTVEVLDFAYIAASEDLRETLRLPSDGRVQKSIRIRYLDGKPLCHVTTSVPEEIGENFGKKDLMSSEAILSLVERSGIAVEAAQQTISATLADGAVAVRLNVPVGAPLISIRRLVFDRNNQPVLLSVALYNPDYYQYGIKLVRVHGKRVQSKINKWKLDNNAAISQAELS